MATPAASARRVGVAFDGRAPLADLAAQAKLAERCGASTLWIASHLFLRDPITAAATALAATDRVRVALMAMSPYAMHPVGIAMAAAGLDELHPGRVVLSLGVGAPGDLAAAGIEAPRPIGTLRESIRICRALFAGETIRHEGQVYRVNGRRLAGAPRTIPISLAASGPQMLELAGAQADGVLISAATSPPFIEWCLEHVARGEEQRKARGQDRGVTGGQGMSAASGEKERAAPGAGDHTFERTALVYTRIADVEETALDAIRRNMAFILRGRHHAKNVELAGTRVDQGALFEAYRNEDWFAVERLVTDDVIRRHAAAGTAAQIRAAYDRYAALGLDELVIGGIDDTRELERALEALGR